MKHPFLLWAAAAAMAFLPALPAFGEDGGAPGPARHKRLADDGTDQRIVDLAELMVKNLGIKAGEHVLINAVCVPDDLVVELIRSVRYADGIPHARISHSRVDAEMRAGRTDGQFELEARLRMEEARAMDVVIILQGEPTPAKNRITSKGKVELMNKHLVPVALVQHEEKRWCQLCWPTAATAARAGMSHKALVDHYLECCLTDMERLRPAMEKLKAMLEATDEVRLVGPGTDLTFSIKGIPVIAGYAEYNMPDGEVFTAPVRESVNGTWRVNMRSLLAGNIFEDINLRFENGRIVECSSSDRLTDIVLPHILDMDEDSHYLGEFGIGVNPCMQTPILDTLHDEKIAGTFHLAIGRCITFVPNGNNGTLLHWDLVTDQREAAGGGEMYFDGKLIRKDGKFLDPELAPLNPKD